jgi:hypothetical protein
MVKSSSTLPHNKHLVRETPETLQPLHGLSILKKHLQGKYPVGNQATRKTGNNDTGSFFNALMHMSFKIIKGFFSLVWTYTWEYPKSFGSLLLTCVVAYMIFSGMTSSSQSPGEMSFPHATPVTYSAWQDCERHYKCTSPSVQNGDLEFEIHDVDMPDVFLNPDTGSIMIASKSCGSIKVKVKSKRDTNVMLLTVTHEVPKCIPAALAAMQQNQMTTTGFAATGFFSGIAGGCTSIAGYILYTTLTMG